ncbi:Sulfite exporter TauE/SafE [Actinopolymorpha singaporensis]|uniref:Probable membrane transporter protein n=1 Tax=Actinopolymorpha singaporensis TaxID=117157 RepID=A0A1H1LMQ2_9ACTN|nr:Sulfite exporter TauE/SafE [Actinopolymorpha singaporensis]
MVLTALLVIAATFATALLSAIAGFGGGVLLLPVFVAVFGAREAVAILTVVQLASNANRVWFNRHEVDRRLVTVFACGAVPAAVAGALLFAKAPLPSLTRIIGVFVLLMVVWRRLRPAAVHRGDGRRVGRQEDRRPPPRLDLRRGHRSGPRRVRCAAARDRRLNRASHDLAEPPGVDVVQETADGDRVRNQRVRAYARHVVPQLALLVGDRAEGFP